MEKTFFHKKVNIKTQSKKKDVLVIVIVLPEMIRIPIYLINNYFFIKKWISKHQSKKRMFLQALYYCKKERTPIY